MDYHFRRTSRGDYVHLRAPENFVLQLDSKVMTTEPPKVRAIGWKAIGCLCVVLGVCLTCFTSFLFMVMGRGHEHVYEPATITLVRDLPPEKLAELERDERRAKFKVPRSAIFLRKVTIGDEEEAPTLWVVRPTTKIALPGLTAADAPSFERQMFDRQPPALKYLGKDWEIDGRPYSIAVKRTVSGDYLAFSTIPYY
jgi:hypothetical protein